MKKILAIFSMVVLVGAMTGCKEYLDINDNPNYPTTTTPEGLLTSAEIYTGTILGGDVQLVTSIWNQYYTQCTSTNQYWTVVRNNLTYASTYFSYIWNQYYLYAIPNAKTIQKLASEKDGYYSYEVVGKILEGFDWYILNSLFDQIAYTNGTNGIVDTNPEFDSSANSYKAVLGIFESILTGSEAVDLSEAQNSADNVLVDSGRDYIFNGNMENWLKFANTIYLKILMRDFSANTTKIEDALANGYGFIDETSGAATIDIFVDLANKSNPLYESDRRMLNTADNIRASKSITDVLNANSDTRISVYFEGTTGAQFNAGGSKNGSSRAKLAPTDAVYFITIADSYLTQAEAYTRLGKPAADIKALYDKGVNAAFEMWGLDGSSFVAASGAYEFDDTAATEEMIEQIITQKWLAGVRSNAWDSWFDLNRTNYPEYGTVLMDYSGSLGETGSGKHPRRFMYPQRSALYNVNAPTTVALDVKMWWHAED